MLCSQMCSEGFALADNVRLKQHHSHHLHNSTFLTLPNIIYSNLEETLMLITVPVGIINKTVWFLLKDPAAERCLVLDECMFIIGQKLIWELEHDSKKRESDKDKQGGGHGRDVDKTPT